MTIYRSDVRDPLPGVKEWADTLDLTRRGLEFVGPCPLCGGDDRFHVRDSGGRAAVGCRGCIDGQPDGERRARFGEVLRAVFPARAVTPPPPLSSHLARRPWLPGFSAPPPRFPARVPRTPPAPGNGGEAARGAIAGRLWAAAVPADDTPARVYLAGRSVWPPDSIGPGLPASVRWLHRGAVRRDVAADWYDVPEHTAGAIVYAFRQPGGATIRAVGLDALDGGGRQPGKRWRRTFGQKKGAAFAVGAVGGDPLVIVEGEADALASVWLHPGAEVWAAGGGGAPALAPAILENRRRVVIEADPDGPGRDAALKLDAALGGRAEISWNQGGDPADVWTETLGERAAILEFDGGLPRHESEQRAWTLTIERR